MVGEGGSGGEGGGDGGGSLSTKVVGRMVVVAVVEPGGVSGMEVGEGLPLVVGTIGGGVDGVGGEGKMMRPRLVQMLGRWGWGVVGWREWQWAWWWAGSSLEWGWRRGWAGGRWLRWLLRV